MKLYVGLQVFLMTLQVMNIHPSYNILLGRPWIHVTEVIASSLHQYLKYIMNGMSVTIKAKKIVSMIREKLTLITSHDPWF
jgi:hypothetical protein